METIDDYLDRLASGEAVPGGGSAAALTGALAAALVAMVGRIASASIGGLVESADALRASFEAARRRDERAYATVIAAQALPKATEGERAARRDVLEGALREAADAPLDAAGLALGILRLADRLIESPRGALASDVGCACELAYAALAACAYNVRINHRYMHDAATIAEQAARLDAIERDGSAILERVRAAL